MTTPKVAPEPGDRLSGGDISRYCGGGSQHDPTVGKILHVRYCTTADLSDPVADAAFDKRRTADVLSLSICVTRRQMIPHVACGPKFNPSGAGGLTLSLKAQAMCVAQFEERTGHGTEQDIFGSIQTDQRGALEVHSRSN